MNERVYLNDLGVICALGDSLASVRKGLFATSPSGVCPNDTLIPGRSLHLGQIRTVLPDMSSFESFERSRNNALLLAALSQIGPTLDGMIERYGPDRVAVVLGTSTSGIGECETAVAEHQRTGHLPLHFHLAQQELGSAALFVRKQCGLHGVASVTSTACSSSAKAMASAARMLRAGMCDAVVTGGMDSLCAFTVSGFSALESVDAGRCNPLSVNRRGINIGEGGALFVMSRDEGPVSLAGWGESSDAYHISSPAPDGRGALNAMRMAMQRAGVEASDIDYINLHGTATVQNDAMESVAVQSQFGSELPVSSTKPLTGHTLGGAGALEAALCWLTLQNTQSNRLPPHWWDGQADSTLPKLRVVAPGECADRPLRYALSNSFAFGGSNAALVLGRE